MNEYSHQEKIFVYGTLGLGGPNEHILTKIGGSWLKGTVKGILIEEGWGAEMGYPGLKIDPKGELINGFVFSSDNLQKYWQELDDFEGSAYQRVMTSIEAECGDLVEAYVYILKN